MTVDSRVRAYLGRILDTSGNPVGTCFQVSPGLLATAWHVVDNLGTNTVTVDALNGDGEPAEATVLRTDPLHDLAVLRTPAPLATSVPG
jgi:S1-C subfamily serine protease